MCSPVSEDEKALLSLAGKLKKYNVSVDFVLFGDLDSETQQKLTKFNEKVKGAEGSHLVVIPPSGSLLSDHLKQSPLMAREGAAEGGGGGDAGGEAGGEFSEFGFDPSTDPELALALRMSMEEETARQQKRAREEEDEAKKASLGAVKEEDESAPLLDKDGEASGSGSGSNDTKKEGKDDDKMDTS